MNQVMLHVPLAVTGMACRLPGADDLAEYWQLLLNGKSAIGEFPQDRLDRELYYRTEKPSRGTTYATIGGFIRERAVSSPGALSADELRRVDPCHAIFCDVALEACRHAGLDPKNLAHRNAGVYVGHSAGSPLGGEVAFGTMAPETLDYLRDVAREHLPADILRQVIEDVTQRLRDRRQKRDSDGGPFTEANMAAALVAQVLGLTGPHMVIDAACASSLVALALAGLALQDGQIDMAIVGGASFNKSDSLILFSQAQSCSATGSHPFDTNADGLVSSEGYVAFVVKTLPRALADGDSIHAVIRGLGLASDGRGRSLWAPRKEGQLAALERAYGPDLNPADVDFIEAHATSTQVGDATELEALAAYFRPRIQGRKIPIGSVKSNIGHCLETAGMAGLLKTILALQHRVVPPTINLRELNRSIPWSEIPFTVPTQPEAWPSPVGGRPRRAGVNAFGIGGLNVHVVVEEFSPSSTAGHATAPVAIHHDSKNGSHSTNGDRHKGVGTKADAQGIAIIGRGVILPGAQSIAALARLIADGTSLLRDAPKDRWRKRIGVVPGPPAPGGSSTCRGGFIEDYAYDWKTHKIPPKQIAFANPLQFMLLDAARQALAEAGYDQRPFDRQRAAVVVGSIFGGEFGQQLQVGLRLPEVRRDLIEAMIQRGVRGHDATRIVEAYTDLILRLKPALLDETGSFTCSTLASRITKTFDLMGGALALDAGECSSFAALSTASNLLSSGACSLVLCAAAQRALDLASYEMLSLSRRMAGCAEDGSGEQGSGYFPGEGVAVLLLKRLEDAQKDGDRILNVIGGIAAANDSGHLASAIATAAQRTLQRSKTDLKKVTSIVAGCGVGRTDLAEANGLASVYGPSVAITGAPPLVQQIGHLQAAQGLTTLIQTTLTLSEGTPADSFAALSTSTSNGLAYHVLVGAAPASNKATPEPAPSHGLSTSKPTAAVAPATPVRAGGDLPRGPQQESRVARFGASSVAEMQQLLARANQEADKFFGAAADSRFSSTDRLRIALVANDVASFGQRLKLTNQNWTQLESRPMLEEQGVFVGECGPQRPRLAFLFPGQGSQYAGMLKSLLEVSPAARSLRAEADRLLSDQGWGTFSAMVDDAQKLGGDIWVTQAAILLADAFMYAALDDSGIRPDCLAGHSFGEIPALVAAGAWTLEQSLRVTRARADAILQSSTGRGTLLSVAASAEVIQSLITRGRHHVFLTHYNTPEQTVVGGSEAAVLDFIAALKANGLHSQRLAVPCPFHTPLMGDAQAPLCRALTSEPLHPPGRPLMSSVTNRFAANPDEIRKNLVDQLVTPVNYVQMVERLWEDGVRVFVEVGPQQVLTRLNRRVLDGRPAFCLAADHPSRTFTEQLARIRAALECAGIPCSKSQPLSVPTSAPNQNVIELFDATAARRARLRNNSAGYSPNGDNDARSPAPRVEQFDATAPRRQQFAAAAKQRSFQPASGNTSMTLPESDRMKDADPAPQVDAPNGGLPVESESLYRFLIDFVAEQTGYPIEIIDLDWDIEADLGLDSIKKAQLFGELREFFEIDTSKVVIGEFRTLRQVGDFLQNCHGKGEWLAPSAPVVERQIAPESNVAMIETTPTPSPGPAHSDRAQFLIDFVVEQTGYPPEVVDLDAEFEADLGIDSIKKAQLFGELREQFSLSVNQGDGMSLADFRTLRHVLALLDSAQSVPESTAARPVQLAPVISATLVDHLPDVSPAASVIDSTAPRYQRGFAFGRQDSKRIRQWLRRAASEVPFLAAGTSTALAEERVFSDEEMQELHGLAAGAGVHVTGVIAHYRRLPVNGHDSAHALITNDADTSRVIADVATSPAAVDSASTGITKRHVLRMKSSPQPSDAPSVPSFAGPALILGDNAVARALQLRLRELGTESHIVAPTDRPEDVVSILEDLWQKKPLPHLFITTPRDEDAVTTGDSFSWKRRRVRGILSPFWLCQRWIKLVKEAGLMDDACLVGVTSLGGDFGFQGPVHSIESGAITGLLKSIIIESWVHGFRTIPIKLIDAPLDEPAAAIAAAVCRELAVPSYDVEIAWAGGERQVVRAITKSIPPDLRRPLPARGTWVCTGGARGITAYVCKEMALRYGGKWHLIGTAPAPAIPAAWHDLEEDGLKRLKIQVMQQARTLGRSPIKAWEETEKSLEIDRNLRELAKLGVSAQYHSCDIADHAALARVLANIRAVDGPISGILHGAGVGKDSSFEQKKPEKVDQCIRAKVDGALALMELTRNDPLRWFVAFGSISGRFGANGHTDYSLANDMLAKVVDAYRRQRPEVASTTFHWHAWGDVGMATKAETRLALEMAGLQFMPAREGWNHLLAELEAGVPEGEILITDDKYYRLFYPAETLGDGDEESKQAGILGEQRKLSAAFPLLDAGVTETDEKRAVSTVTMDPAAEIFLAEHRLDDKPLLPVVIGLELICEAAARLAGERQVVAVRNVQALSGLRFHTDTPQTVRVQSAFTSAANVAVEIAADFHARNGRLVEPNRKYLAASVEIGDPLSNPISRVPQNSNGEWHLVEYPPRGSKFYLGPPLRCLRKIRMARQISWGRIVAPSLVELAGSGRSVRGWIVPCAALDACLYATGLLAWHQVQAGPSLPESIGTLRIASMPHPGEACLVESRFLDRTERHATFAFTLFGSDGRVILDVENYRVVWLAVTDEP